MLITLGIDLNLNPQWQSYVHMFSNTADIHNENILINKTNMTQFGILLINFVYLEKTKMTTSTEAQLKTL